MRPIPLVTGWNLLPFVHFLRGIGAPVGRWLAESGIPPTALEIPNRPVPLDLALDFAERAAQAEAAESLGIDVGRHTAAEGLGRFGSILAKCPTLYCRARASCRLLSRLNNYSLMWLDGDDTRVMLHLKFAVDRTAALRHAEDFSLMLMLDAIGRAAPPGWKPEAIMLPGTRSKRFERDELFQGVKMSFHAPSVAIAFSSELLSRPLRSLDEDFSPAFRPDAKHGDDVVATDFVGSLQDTVATLLPLHCPSIQELADLARTAPRTLQRRLSESGTSLREVIDRARFGLADEYLSDTSAAMTDIAFELGYSDSTAFARAFHRLAGVAPTTYRAQRLDS